MHFDYLLLNRGQTADSRAIDNAQIFRCRIFFIDPAIATASAPSEWHIVNKDPSGEPLFCQLPRWDQNHQSDQLP